MGAIIVFRFPFLLLLLLLAVAPAHALENRLAGNPSPYLALHGNDLVHWQSWSADLLTLARRENKLIFISSGYFTCHWCHVMQRESFRDAEVAALLNAHFIPVKIDRELLPAIDQHLIDFVQATQGNAGWPLNVFLTPEGYPLVGALYQQREDFVALLDKLAGIWSERPQQTRELARRVLLSLTAEAPSDELPAPDPEWLRQALLGNTWQQADEFQGGFGQQGRFPMVPQLRALLALQRARPDERLAAFLRLTLDQVMTQGLRDHLGGGFFRYTVDPDWQVPHYEKMLYSQAQLVLVFLEAADVLAKSDYLAVAADTLDFVLAEMASGTGGYIAALSAVDDEGREGSYYLWSESALAAAGLSDEELALAREHWRLQGTPGEGYLPVLAVSASALTERTGRSLQEIGQLLAAARSKLRSARAQRSLPRDGKVLAGWNGLLMAALSAAAKRLHRADYAEAAAALKDELMTRLWDGERLQRAAGNAGGLGEAALEDYAYVAYGLDRQGDVAARDAVLRSAWRLFHIGNGWRLSAEPALPGMAADVLHTDGALPSPSALILRLSLASGDEALRESAIAALDDGLVALRQGPFWYASHALLLLDMPTG